MLSRTGRRPAQSRYSRSSTLSIGERRLRPRRELWQSYCHQHPPNRIADSSKSRPPRDGLSLMSADRGPSRKNSDDHDLLDNEMDLIKSKSKVHPWHWNEYSKSHECLVSDDRLEVCFHPECAESAAAIRGSQPMIQNGNYYYWEITIYDKIFGTSMMFGLCTEEQSLHQNDYCNLIGLDKNGWSLSHKGLIWHSGKNCRYTDDFATDQTVTIGLLFDTMRGELSYFLDGKNLGVAFCGLNRIDKNLYPVIGSTAKRTKMRLTGSYCGYVSLLERSCYTLLKGAQDREALIRSLESQNVPRDIIRYMAEIAEVCGRQTEKSAKTGQYIGM